MAGTDYKSWCFFFDFLKNNLTFFKFPRVISRKMIFSAKIPSKCPLKLAISEGIFHFCEKNLQKGVGKYTFKSFIGRGTKLFHNFSKSCPLLALQIQSKVSEGANKSKRKNDKNAKKYHEFFASCQVI